MRNVPFRKRERAPFVLLVLAAICYGLLPSCGRQVQGKELGAKDATPSEIQAEVGEELEQKVLTFSLAGYGAGGKKEWEVGGDSADVTAFDQVRLKDVVIKVYGEKDSVTITADEGSYNKVTNDARLEKNVVVSPQDGGRLEADYLDWASVDKTITTDSFAQVEKDNLIATGKGILGNPELKTVQMNEEITVEVKPNVGSTTAPTIITCDGPLEVDYENHIAHFNKNVVVTDSRGKILADKMEVTIDKTTRNISKVICSGNVRISREKSRSFSEEATYLAEEGRVILTGSPKLIIYPGEIEEIESER